MPFLESPVLGHPFLKKMPSPLNKFAPPGYPECAVYIYDGCS